MGMQQLRLLWFSPILLRSKQGEMGNEPLRVLPVLYLRDFLLGSRWMGEMGRMPTLERWLLGVEASGSPPGLWHNLFLLPLRTSCELLLFAYALLSRILQ